jgi:hypothetical protein
MTKAERRINDFSSGIKQLSDESRNYIHKLTHVLHLVEKPPIYPGLEKKNHRVEKRREIYLYY